MLGAGVSALSGVGVVLAVTRGLAPTDSGTFFALISLFLIVATSARLGTPTGLVYFLTQGTATQAFLRRLLQVALLPALLTAAVGSFVLFVFAEQLLTWMGLDSSTTVSSLRVLAVFLPFAVLLEGLLATARGFGKMRPTILIDRIGRLTLQLLLIVVAAMTTHSLFLVTCAWAVPYLIAVALAARQIIKVKARCPQSIEQSLRPLRFSRFWRYTAPRSIAAIVQITLQRLDIILIAALVNPAMAAVYTAATRFVVVGQLGNQAVSLAAQPRLGWALARDDTAGVNLLYRTATTWLVLVNWPLYLLSILFAEPMLALFGVDSQEGRLVIVILALAMLLATACGMVEMVLSMSGRTSWNLYNNIAALVVALTLDLVLIPRIGIVGAATGWAAAICVNNLVPLAQIATVQRVHPFGRGPLVAVVLAGVSFGVVPLMGVAASNGLVTAGGVGCRNCCLRCGMLGVSQTASPGRAGRSGASCRATCCRESMIATRTMAKHQQNIVSRSGVELKRSSVTSYVRPVLPASRDAIRCRDCIALAAMRCAAASALTGACHSSSSARQELCHRAASRLRFYRSRSS